MKNSVIGMALALSLLGGTSALAEHDHGGQGADGPQGGSPGGGGHGVLHGGSGPQGGPPGGGAPHGGLAPQGGPPAGGGEHRFFDRGGPGGGQPVQGWQDRGGRDHGQGGQDWRQGGGDRGQDWGHDRGGHDRSQDRFQGGDHNRGFGGDGDRPRYDRRAYPGSIRPDHRYRWRGGEWYPPEGYYYRHWGYGMRLPYGWYDQQWYIDDYYDYDLPIPPYGYEWVRVGPDALLIDLDTGMVVEAEYGLFW
jgi:Ni/Co efflux regulator RcnB